MGPLLWTDLLFVVVVILVLLAAQQNQRHTSTHYPQALGSQGTFESLVKCSHLQIIF